MKDWYEKYIKVINILLVASVTLLLIVFLIIPFLLGYKFNLIRHYSLDFERFDTLVSIVAVIMTSIVAIIPLHILKVQTQQNTLYQKHSEGINLYKLRITLLQSIKEIESVSARYNCYDDLSLEINLLYDENVYQCLGVCNEYYQKMKHLESKLDTWKSALKEYSIRKDLYSDYENIENNIYLYGSDDGYEQLYIFTDQIEKDYKIDFSHPVSIDEYEAISFRSTHRHATIVMHKYEEARSQLEESMQIFIKESISLKSNTL